MTNEDEQAKREPTFDPDERCEHCNNKKPHSASEHDEAIFATYKDGEP